MKKKFINGLLLAALFLGFTGSMVSCKDYDDEKIVNVVGALADSEAKLYDALKAQKSELEKLIKDLQDQITACKNTCSEFRDWTKNEFNKYLTLVAFNEFKSDLEVKLSKFYTKEEIDAKFRAFEDKYYTKEQIDEMFKQLDNYYTKDQVYTKAEVDALLEDKLANITNYYTKEEVDNLLANIKTEIDIEAIANTISELLQEGNTTLVNAFNNYFINNPIIDQYFIDGKGSEIINQHITNALISVNDSIGKVAAISNEALRLALENKGRIDQLEINYNSLKETVDDLVIRMGNVEGRVGDLEGAYSNLNGFYTDLEKRVKALEEIVEGLPERITNLETTTEELKKDIISLNERIDEVSETANSAYAQALANSILIDKLFMGYDMLDGRIEGLEEGLDELKAKIYEDSLAADALHREMLETISGLVAMLEGIEIEQIINIQENIQQFITENVEIYVTEEVTNINNYITDVSDQLTELINNEINIQVIALQKLTQTFENTMAKLITGININGTDCHFFGEFSLPLDVRSNLLLAYYGTLDDYGYEFPTDRPAYNALDNGQTITEEDIEMIGDLKAVDGYKAEKNTTIVSMDGAVGNAGTLYLTVNPTNRDFTGTEFELINSRNETSSVVLSDLTKSDHLLNFGYTRSGVASSNSNGFYQTKATITKAALKDNRLKPSFNSNGVKALFEQVVNDHTTFLTGVTNAIYRNISNILEADAVKATWNDEQGSRSVISQYSIAATAVNPLSFAFGKDFKYEVAIGYDEFEKFLDKLLGKMGDFIPTMGYRIEDLEITGYYPGVVSPSDVFIEFDVTVFKKAKNDSRRLHIFFDLAEWMTIFPDTTADMDDIEELTDAIMDYIEDLNDIISGDFVDNIKESILEMVVNEVNAHPHLARFLREPNRLLQPILLVLTDDGYMRMTKTPVYPAIVETTKFRICPTTYTGEILAPAYKKFVAVTNVSKGNASAKGGDPECKAILDEANAQEGMMKVTFGGIHPGTHFDFTAKAGYTYEMVYSALDYAGKVVTRHFYLTVSE